MNFLTIEKFRPSKAQITIKILMVSIMLVVPFASVTVWFWLNLVNLRISQAVTDNNEEIIYQEGEDFARR